VVRPDASAAENKSELVGADELGGRLPFLLKIDSCRKGINREVAVPNAVSSSDQRVADG